MVVARFVYGEQRVVYPEISKVLLVFHDDLTDFLCNKVCRTHAWHGGGICIICIIAVIVSFLGNITWYLVDGGFTGIIGSLGVAAEACAVWTGGNGESARRWLPYGQSTTELSLFLAPGLTRRRRGRSRGGNGFCSRCVATGVHAVVVVPW